MKAYDNALRNKILDYLAKNGGTKVEACETSGIEKSTLSRWLKLKGNAGDVKPNVRENKPRKVDYERLKALVTQQPDATLKELAKPFGMTPRGVSYALDRLTFTRKKRLAFTQKPIQKNDYNSSD